MPALRANGAKDVGITINVWPQVAATDDPGGVAAAERQSAAEAAWYLDRLYGKGYPQDVMSIYAARGWAPEVRPGDMERIATPTDFLGLNYYSRSMVRDDPASAPLGVAGVDEPGEYTETGWLVHPGGLRDLLTRVHRDHRGPPRMFVTENGAAFLDVVAPDGAVHDDRRVAYLPRPLRGRRARRIERRRCASLATSSAR